MKQQTILITGASSGIGKAAAFLLHEKGHRVYAAARQTEKMKDLEQAGIGVLSLDVTKEDSILAAVQHIFQEAGVIDVLVNNAGYGSYGALEDVPLSEARYQFEVNIFGLARLTQLVIPRMREQHYGKIINISSIGGKLGEPHGAWYHATKFAVEGLSDSIRMELKQFGIQVVIIEPGAIKTEWTGIARENLLKVSGNSAYQDLARKHARMFETADKRGASPKVVAKTIERAIRSSNPRTRYASGGGAKPILFLRRILSDKQFDKIMLSLMK
jgi:NAD(P)-dependent dehydrogenase (short-subunit alcohol dehydrogenase family)